MIRGALALALLIASSAAAAPPRATLSSPGTLPGDGGARATLSLLIDPAPPAPVTVEAIADAGRIDAVRPTGPGSFEIAYAAPRVVSPFEATVTVLVDAGRLRATAGVKLVPPPQPLAEASSAGPLDLRGPRAMILGVHASAPVSLRRGEGPPPALSASAGQISAPVEADGRWRATYTPPAERFPRIAIVSAVSADGVVDFLAIRLDGLGRVETKTRPNASVVIRVDDVSYGPVRADRAGLVTLDVITPPGVTSGVAVAEDRAGNRREVAVDLAPPPLNRLHAACVPSPGAGGRVLLFAVDAAGRPRSEEAFELESPAGRLGPPVLVRPGLWESRLVARPGGADDEAPVVARLRGAAGSRATCAIRLEAEPPQAIEVTVDPAAYTAGSGATVTVSARPRWAGRRRGGVEIGLAVDVGRLGEPRRQPDGSVAATWVPPDRFGGRATASVTARGPAPSPSGQATLALRPGPVARLELAPPARLIADGRSATTIAVRALDAFDNPVPDARVTARAEHGTADGAAGGVRYTAPRDYARRADTVLVSDERAGVSGSVHVPLQPARRRFAAGARVGFLTNFGKLAAPIVLADASLRLPILREHFAIGLAAGFYGSSASFPSTQGDPVAIATSAAPILGQLIGSIAFDRIGLYAGLGGGLVIARVEISSPSAGMLAVTDPAPAVAGLAGADLALGPGRIGLEAAYWYAALSNPALAGNVGGLVATVGYRLER